MKRRVVSLVTALALCLSLCPTWALAAEAEPDTGLCPHHTSHTAECGYTPPTPDKCSHEHDDACYAAQCIHQHAAGCYQGLDPDTSLDSDPGNDPGPDEQEALSCTHVCSVESGCVVLSCTHEHDGSCYAPGMPCTYVCSICPAEDQEADGDHALYDVMTASEQNSDKLTANWSGKTPYAISGVLDLNGWNLTGMGCTAIQVRSTDSLSIVGTGTIASSLGIGIEVQSGGSLIIDGNTSDLTISGTTYGLDVAAGAVVSLSGGMFSGATGAAIRVADGNFSRLLAPGCAYFDADGAPIPAEGLATARTIVVKACTDHTNKTYALDPGATTHTWTCAACGTKGTEPCTFTTYDENRRSVCDRNCKNEITIAVDQDSLKALAYDETIKPANGTVKVTLKDGTVLAQDDNYTVSYSTSGVAGNADVTVTVTVTGKTYNGTYTQSYKFDKADLPVLEWDTTDTSVPVTVTYTGQPVEKSELPDVIINITSNTDLSDHLQYSYKKGTETTYTNGLPTNVGTYDVIVTLPGNLANTEDGQAASSEPLTVTILKLDPIQTAPIATKPVYNKQSQELVTAGELEPAAANDGAKILFATSEDGQYSETIPTGINANQTYEVWYRVEATDNCNAFGPKQVGGVEIQRKRSNTRVDLEYTSVLFDGGKKEPKVTVYDSDDGTVLPSSEYEVTYSDNQDVGRATARVTDQKGGNYEVVSYSAFFQITLRTQETLSITNKPNTFTYGDVFTLSTEGGSGNGDVTWEIVGEDPQATVNATSGQVRITGDGSITVKATKSGTDPVTNVKNYEDATATWEFTADKKAVTATVTAEDKTYDGNTEATVHAVVEQGVLPGDEITITGLKGTFDNENAGTDKTVTLDFTNRSVTGKNSEHYDITYSSTTTVKANINKAAIRIGTVPTFATGLIYNKQSQELLTSGATVVTGTPAQDVTVTVEYALSEDGPYKTEFPSATDAGSYKVWYRVPETQNYNGIEPDHVDVTIGRKQVEPTITLSGEGLQVDDTITPATYSYTYDGSAKTPTVTVKDGDDTILASNYTVEYSNNVNVGNAKVTVTANEDGNYEFKPTNSIDVPFTIQKEKAQVTSAPKRAGDPLTYNTRKQELVTAGEGTGGTMVYKVEDPNNPNAGFSSDIPTGIEAGEYTVHYKIEGDKNHSDSDVGTVKVTIAPKRVKDPTIELKDVNGDPLVSYTYDGSAKKPEVVVKDGATVIDRDEYNIVYSDNTDAGHATVNITAKPDHNYDVTGSKTFVILKADIKDPKPTAADITYNGKAQELLEPGTTSGGTVLYALGSSTSTYTDAIPTGIEARGYAVYYKVVGDKNHNDFPITLVENVEIKRKPLTTITIELTPDVFEYDGQSKMPEIAVWDGKTKLPEEEYDWVCDADSPTDKGIYTITISDAEKGNYDLTGVVDPNNKATFTIGQTTQAELVIESKPGSTVYGDTFTLTTKGGSGTGTVTWSADGAAEVDERTGEVTITGVGEATITATNSGDRNYLPISAQWKFTAAPKPVTASVTVANKDYDGTTGTTVTAASITTLPGDMVTIDPASIKAEFDTPDAGRGKTVTLDTSNVQVTGDDVNKYDITYPKTVTADIEQATTTITAPEEIENLEYNREAQELVKAGETNVGFIVYSLDGTNFSPEIPTGTDAGDYTVYYKVDETANYVGDAGGTILVTIAPKSITPKIVLSATSYVYDGSKKEPLITVKDEKVVIDEDQYTVAWTGDKSQTEEEMLTVAGTYRVTITSKTEGNYSFQETAKVQITPAEQDAISITGQPEHVCYGDKITTLRVTGGSGNGTVEWSIAPETTGIKIHSKTGEITIQNTGTFTVTAERSVPNHKTVTDTCTFTVEPKPVTAVVTVDAKEYDGKTTVAETAIKAVVNSSDLVDEDDSDSFTIAGLTGTYDDANAGTNKSVTLNASNATGWNKDKYAVSFPKTATADINRKEVTVTVTLSGNDLQTDTTSNPPEYFYIYDGTEKKPTVTVAVDSVALPASEYTFSYSNNKNVSTDGNPATVTVTSTGTGNYTFEVKPVPFTIRNASAQLKRSPGAKDLTYTGQKQELVTVGEAEGGHIEYSVDSGDYGKDIPKKTNAGTYTVHYKVVPDSNHQGEAPSGSVSVTIKQKEIVDPIVTVDASDTYIYNGGTPVTPDKGKIEVKDGTKVILDNEYDVSYRDNINAGTATVVITNANGGNYIVNGTGTFTIEKDTASVAAGGAPEGKENLPYNGTEQELVTAGTADKGTMVYSLSKEGPYSPAIPTAKEVGEYTVWYMAQGDSNYNDSAASRVEPSVSIIVNEVTTPNIQIVPESVTYNGKKQEPTVTVRDDAGLLIDGSEYTVTYETSDGNDDLILVGEYTVTIKNAEKSNYEIIDSSKKFTILPADQRPLLITDTRTDVRYGDKIQLNTTGGNGKVEWSVESSVEGGVASFSETTPGLLEITGVGSGTVTATSKADGYTDQTATWTFYANAKEVTAVLTGVSRPYADNDLSVTVKATVPASELVPDDTITIEDLRGTFSDPNVGTDKKVTVDRSKPTVSGKNCDKYAITYPDTTTASITKADIKESDFSAPAVVTTGLEYTGTPLALVTAGSVASSIGTMEYSLDNSTYSTNLPTGTDAKGYDVWYRVKGDSNHNDVEAVKLTEDAQITITPQEVDDPTIEFTPSGASYDGAVHKPAVTVKDKNGRVIPAGEYEVDYGTADWTQAGDYTVKVKDKEGGNYTFTEQTPTFTILPMGQNPLSILNQPSKVQYGDTFTLVATGGTGTVTWVSSVPGIAEINAQTGLVTVKGVGGPVTITATRDGGGNYADSTATWTFSAEKKPVTAIVTADDKEYDTNTKATIHVTWQPALINNDEIKTTPLSGTFADPKVGTNKTVNISGTPVDDSTSQKYDITIPSTTTASITKKAADEVTLNAPELTYNGKQQILVEAGAAAGKEVAFSRDGFNFSLNVPTEQDAGKYKVWYKVLGDDNHSDSAVKLLEVTIKPKTVTDANLKIELSPEEFDYDGKAKKPDVTVKDGTTVIPASEYTVSYSNNVNASTTDKPATVTITDSGEGNNYEIKVSTAKFTIKAAVASLDVAPKANNLTYNGSNQELLTPGTAINGDVVYSSTKNGTYTKSIPTEVNAGTYEVWYKVNGKNGATVSDPEAHSVTVTIQQKQVTPTILLENGYSYTATYTGNPVTPTVTVIVDNKVLTQLTDYLPPVYSSNTNVGTATVIVQSMGTSNYQFYGITTFEIVKAKAEFLKEPTAIPGLVYNGTEQKLVRAGISLQGTVLYSMDASTFTSSIPVAVNVDEYTVFAKIMGNGTYADSDIKVITGAKISQNVIEENDLIVEIENNIPYTGKPLKPEVTVSDAEGNTISATEYNVTYSNNTEVGTANARVKSKGNNYSFDKTVHFTIIGAGQTPLTITGKQDTVYYGDVLSLGTTGGSGTGNVTWSISGGNVKQVEGSTSQFEIIGAGPVTIKATMAGVSGYNEATDTWTFTAKRKPITATVIAADRSYVPNDKTVELTVTVNPRDLVGTDTFTLNATGHFVDANVGQNKTVIVDGLTIPDEVKAKYDISYPSTVTASINPAQASVAEDNKPKAADQLIYNGQPQDLLADPGTATGGDIAYSLNGTDFSLIVPTGTDAKTYTVWYKVLGDGNYTDSPRYKLESGVTIAQNTDTPTVWLDPAVVQYDTTAKSPTVRVLDNANREISKEEYTVEFTTPTPWTAVGDYIVTVKNVPGGNYEFTEDVTATFKIVPSSQNPLSITNLPDEVHYGDTFRLSAIGGSGTGEIVWSTDNEDVATVDEKTGQVKVIGTGAFTITAYRDTDGSYSESNKVRQPFSAEPKRITPVVTAEDKSYDGNDTATVNATFKSGDLVKANEVTLIVSAGKFASPDVGTNKKVTFTGDAGGTGITNYEIEWPDSTTASIYKVDAQLKNAPTPNNRTYDGSAKPLVFAGSTVGDIGVIKYSLSPNGVYSTDIPTATDAREYEVWFKVEETINYTGIAAAMVPVKISGASTPTPSPAPSAAPARVPAQTSTSAPMQTNVQDGTATTVVSASAASELVKEAAANNSQSVVIKPEITDSVTRSEVSIPASAVSQIESETDADLMVSTPVADVTIPNGALSTLSSAGGTVDIVTEQVEQAVVLTVTADGETVESIPGGVTLTVPVEDAGPGTVAVLVHEDGTRETIRKSVTEDGTVRIPLDGSATVEIVDNSKSFDDVPDTSWAADAVAFASARELFNGTSETAFSPDEPMSRAMLATVLYNLEGQPDQSLTSEFSDVSSDAWYASGVSWAAEKGITNGYGDGQFGPDDDVTREQFAVMLWKYAGSPEVSGEDLDFTDADQISEYALKALRWAAANGILSGHGDGRLDPSGLTTRAQAAQMLKNFLENI